MKRVVCAWGVSLCALAGVPAAAQVVPRDAPISGRVVSTRSGETAVLVPSPQAQRAEVRQELKAGDVLRTNASGTLAIVFADRTQLRLGRNSILVVRNVQAGSPSSLRLERGSLWGRTPRGGTSLSIETPTAGAAIRGTSWALSASDEEATLQVFEGAIEFANDLGSLRVDAGQAAIARLGQAPSRVFVTSSDERRQMLQYVPVAEGLRFLDAAGVSPEDGRRERARISALPDQSRSAEDWLLLGEIDAQRRSVAERRRILAAARALALTEAQMARSLALEAGIALDEGNPDLALRLYREALPMLSESGGAAAAFGAYAAGLGAGETVPLPVLSGDAAAAASAYLAAYRGEMEEALATIRAAELRRPEALDLQVVKGNIALLLGDMSLLQEAVERGRALDAGDPNVLMLDAQLQSEFRGDHRNALVAARAATVAAPGNTLAWNVLGTVLLGSGATRSAERAFRRGLAARESDALLHANLAVSLLDQDRLAEAEREIDRALALDPGQSVALAYRGRLLIQRGDYDAAEATLLAAAAANPAYGQTALMLSQLHHRQGDYAAAEQQLALAEDYEPGSPFPPIFRAALALDRYEAGAAIEASRQAYERKLASSGPSDVPDRASQYLNRSFRFLGLDDWGRHYSDRGFAPLDAASYLDRAAASQPAPFLVDDGWPLDRQLPTGGAVPPFSDVLPASALEVGGATPSDSAYDAETASSRDKLSNVLQGLTLDPLLVASSTRHVRLFHESFVEGEATGNLVAANGAIRAAQSARFAGLLRATPLAFTVAASHRTAHGRTEPNSDSGGVALQAAFGALLGSDTLAVLATLEDDDREVSGPAAAPRDQGSIGTRSLTLSGVFSHYPTQSLRLSLGVGLVDERTALARRDTVTSSALGADPGTLDADLRNRRRRGFVTAAALLDLGAFTASTGGEVLARNISTDERITFTTADGGRFPLDRGVPPGWEYQYNLFAHARYRLVSSVLIEGHATMVRSCSECDPATEFEYGGAVAYELDPRSRIRVGYIRDLQTDEPFTLALREPAGLRPAAAPATRGSSTRSILFRLENEWSPRVFTAVEIQRQTFEDLAAPVADDFGDIYLEPFEDILIVPGLASVGVGEGTLWRASATANVLLTRRIGIAAAYAQTKEEVSAGEGFGYVPRNFARLRVEWSVPDALRGGAGLVYVGRRRTFDEDVGSFLSLDADIAWRSPDRAFEARLEGHNLLGERIEFYPGYPKTGRQLIASLTARF